jgi:hypothetical protein
LLKLLFNPKDLILGAHKNTRMKLRSSTVE